jgi:hypothetical protein
VKAMEGNFLGLGLKNIIGLFFLFVLMIVVLKVVSLKYEQVPEGVRNVVQTI